METMATVCPSCHFQFPADDSTSQLTVRKQFSLTFLLIGISAASIGCGLAHACGHWAIAPYAAIMVLLVWSARRNAMAVAPGIIIGYLFGATLTASTVPHVVLEGGAFFAALFGCLNMILADFQQAGLAGLMAVFFFSLVEAFVL